MSTSVNSIYAAVIAFAPIPLAILNVNVKMASKRIKVDYAKYVKYLGSTLNDGVCSKKEVSKRLLKQ